MFLLICIIIQLTINFVFKLTKAGVKWLQSPQFSDADVARGKACLKAEVLAEGDSSVRLHESVGSQLLFSGNVITPDALAHEIDKITASDVKNVRLKIFLFHVVH